MGSGRRHCFNAYQLCDRTHKWDKAISLESLGDIGDYLIQNSALYLAHQ